MSGLWNQFNKLPVRIFYRKQIYLDCSLCVCNRQKLLLENTRCSNLAVSMQLLSLCNCIKRLVLGGHVDLLPFQVRRQTIIPYQLLSNRVQSRLLQNLELLWFQLYLTGQFYVRIKLLQLREQTVYGGIALANKVVPINQWNLALLLLENQLLTKSFMPLCFLYHIFVAWRIEYFLENLSDFSFAQLKLYWLQRTSYDAAQRLVQCK